MINFAQHVSADNVPYVYVIKNVYNHTSTYYFLL